MWSARFDNLLAGTAVALALAVAAPTSVALAQSSEAQIDAGVPVPDLTPLPPLTAKDIEAAPPQSQTTAHDQKTPDKAIDAAIPSPDLTPLPPPTAKDIGPIPDTTKAATAPQPPAPAKTAEAPAPTVPAIDAAIADKLHGLAEGKFDRILGAKKERASVEQFYQKRNFAPIWVGNGAVNDRGKAAIAYLAGTAADGLDPSDFPTPDFAAASSPDALAEAEIRLTAAVLTFAHQAQVGRVHFTRVAADISYSLERSDPAAVLSKVADAPDAGKALDSFNPQHPGYKALKAALAKLRGTPAEAKQPRVQIGEGPILRPGMRDERVVSVRKRLDVAGDQNNTLYDEAVAEAVKAFQQEAGIGADGLLGRRTVEAMNGHHRVATRPIDTIIANMERWRWLPHELGNPYVMVNIPDFTLRVVKDGKTVWHTKIVVGKPNKRTPLISASMKYITVNPTWNVPPSIIRNEYLPVLQQDPNALDRIGLKMERNHDGTIRIFQPPGDRNALGRIRFNFPNKFLVYQHDTPDKYLFNKTSRAYSHGCMRVQDPLKYGEVLLSLIEPEKGYTQERLRKMYGGSEININFPHAIPVHLTYQTAYVDDAGKLVFRDDIYGYDSSINAILHGDQRKIASIPIERHDASSSAPVMMPADMAIGDRGGASYSRSEPSFFERLFGVSPEPAPPARQFRQQRRHTARQNDYD